MNSIKVDLHYHGPEEWLGTSRWNALDIAKGVSEKGLDALAITEMGKKDYRFNVLRDNSSRYEKEGLRIEEDFIYIEPFGLVLFRNQEIATESYNGNRPQPTGHILLIGAQKTAIMNLSDILKFADEEKAAVILPHMYGRGHSALLGAGSSLGQEYLAQLIQQNKIHAIEDSALMRSQGPLNFLLMTNYLNNQAVDFAINQNAHIVANSDGHSMREAGSAYTRISSMKVKEKPLLPTDYLTFITENLRNRIADVSRSWDKSPAFSADTHMLHVMGYILKDKLSKK